MVLFDGKVQRPPVIDYKLVDVPELGYFSTDRPHPRGELLVKSENMFPGYYKRPEITADVFDADGYYRTGDIVAEVGPDRLVYLDRRNNVLKLSQGEFVTVAKLEAVFGDSPLVRQIYIYGNSARAYLLAVVVPTEEALARSACAGAEAADHRVTAGRREGRRSAVLRDPARLHRRDNAVHAGERAADRHPQAGAAKLKEHYGVRLEQLYTDLADSQANELRELRRTAPTGRCWRPSAGPRERCSARRLPIWGPTHSSPISAGTRCPR